MKSKFSDSRTYCEILDEAVAARKAEKAEKLKRKADKAEKAKLDRKKFLAGAPNLEAALALSDKRVEERRNQILDKDIPKDFPQSDGFSGPAWRDEAKKEFCKMLTRTYGDFPIFRAAVDQAATELDAELSGKQFAGDDERRERLRERLRERNTGGVIKIYDLEVPDDRPDPPVMPIGDFKRRHKVNWQKFVGIFRGLIIKWGGWHELDERRKANKSHKQEAPTSPDILDSQAQAAAATEDATGAHAVTDAAEFPYLDQWHEVFNKLETPGKLSANDRKLAYERFDEIWRDVESPLVDFLHCCGEFSGEEIEIILVVAARHAEANRTDDGTGPKSRSMGDIATKFGKAPPQLSSLITKLFRRLGKRFNTLRVEEQILIENATP